MHGHKPSEFKALILEYMSNGNLEGWLHPKMFRQAAERSLGLGSRITIAVDIAAALDYLHNRCTPPLVHCDLKPSNVLLDAEMVAHLSDFGLAKFISNGSEFRIHQALQDQEDLSDISRQSTAWGAKSQLRGTSTALELFY